MLITPPAVIFLQANALVTPQPGSIEDWKTHFWSVRKWFFGSNLVLVLAGFLLSTHGLAAESGSSLRYAPPAVGLLVSIVGYGSSSERVHSVLVVIATLTVATGFAWLAV